MAKKRHGKKHNHSSFFNPRTKLDKASFLAILLVLVLVGVILVLTALSNQLPKTASRVAFKTPSLSLTPSSKSVPLSSALAVKIWADTGGQKVNDVQVKLSYPIDKLNFVSINTKGSAFGLAVKDTLGIGKISISRGSFDPLSGKLLVATVNFTGANNHGTATVKFTKGTALVSSMTNKNILSATYDGSFNLTK
ncbi:MAG TPA: cohesin domain-containing protein [Candidatus Saccharimonadales bacterium]|nr:cohesin domain-containing protein [Candidatus Saccharimonadales bacterium]